MPSATTVIVVCEEHRHTHGRPVVTGFRLIPDPCDPCAFCPDPARWALYVKTNPRHSKGKKIALLAVSKKRN